MSDAQTRYEDWLRFNRLSIRAGIGDPGDIIKSEAFNAVLGDLGLLEEAGGPFSPNDVIDIKRIADVLERYFEGIPSE